MNKPTAGRIVHARVRVSKGDPDSDYLPMLVVGVYTDCVVGQVFLPPGDSPNTIIRSLPEGRASRISRGQIWLRAKGELGERGSWRWPPRA